MDLTPAQQAAMDHVSAHAAAHEAEAREIARHVLRMSDVRMERAEAALESIRTNARVCLHFHPDRPLADGRTSLEGMLATGTYTSQFETGLSSGSVSAHPGGPRDVWEQALFGGAYHRRGVSPAERPKYGALDLSGFPDGPSPRFGSTVLVLRPEVGLRCTFTFLDSFRQPEERGTFAHFDHVWATLLVWSFEHERLFGVPMRPPALVHWLCEGLPKLADGRLGRPHSCNLDQYVEAQIHGPVDFRRDVEAIRADACFRDTPVGERIRALHTQCGVDTFSIQWVPGYRLAVADVPSDFRGNTMPSLAERIAPDGTVDAYRLGLAAQDLHGNPAAWEDRGSPAEVLQELKLLWHCLVRYGRPSL